jgi:AraC family transcriptional regulator of adaptative response/methylated-DNA-[protein]-cysteine methyltransferase
MLTLPPISEMHRAVARRDASYDGLFFIAIRSTGIFCRPSCKSRPSLPENREFFATADDAERAGYRACKRCRPLDCTGRPPEWVQALLDAMEAHPKRRWTDRQLRSKGIEPARLRRYFRQHHGMTFQEHMRRRLMGEALLELRRGERLDRVIHRNGYESHSGFRDAFGRTFGGPPGTHRSDKTIVTTVITSPLGPLAAATTDEGICLLEFEPRSDRSEKWFAQQFDCAVVPGDHQNLRQLRSELVEYFAGRRTNFDVPIVMAGTEFQRRVWRQLCRIDFGKTCSYADIARQVGRPAGVRAVGQANGRNPICIIVPCHRVVNSGGKLGGYGGGLWRKQYLLDLEREQSIV